MDMQNAQTSRVARLWLGEGSIVRIIHVPDAEVTMEDARETMAVHLKIYQGKKRPLLVDTKTMQSLARGVRHYYAGEEAAAVASAAVPCPAMDRRGWPPLGV